MPGRLILFDFDGTLADTAIDMLAALNRTLAEHNKAPVSRQAAIGCISGGARALLQKGGIGEAELEKARAVFLRYYEDTGYAQTKLLPGVAAMLQTLNEQNINWGIITNKPRRYFAPIANMLDLRGARAMLCGDDLPKAKPQPDGLLAAATNTPPAHCCYIGDDWRDAAAAANAKMQFIAAVWGYFGDDRQWQNLPVAALASTPSVVPLLARVLLPG